MLYYVNCIGLLLREDGEKVWVWHIDRGWVQIDHLTFMEVRARFGLVWPEYAEVIMEKGYPSPLTAKVTL